MAKLSIFEIILFFLIISNHSQKIDINNVYLKDSEMKVKITLKNESAQKYFYSFKNGDAVFLDNLNDVKTFDKKTGIYINITDKTGKNVVKFITYPQMKLKYLKAFDRKLKAERENRFNMNTNQDKDILIKIPHQGSVSDVVSQMQFKELLNNRDSLFYISVIYSQDSIDIISKINRKKLDSLRQHNIKIFHGTIYSNKVPLHINK